MANLLHLQLNKHFQVQIGGKVAGEIVILKLPTKSYIFRIIRIWDCLQDARMDADNCTKPADTQQVSIN